MSLVLAPRVTRNLFHTDLRCPGCSSSRLIVLLGIWLCVLEFLPGMLKLLLSFWVGWLFFCFFFWCFVLRLEHFEERCSYSRQMPSPCLVLLGSGSAVPQVLGFLRYLELTLKPITLLGLLAYFHNFNWPYCVRLCLTAACSSILPFGVCVVGFVAAFELVQQFVADGPGGFHPAQTPLWQQYAWF